MDYCVTADIQTYLANFKIDAGSDPSVTQVDQMCTDVSENIIDPVVGRYLDLPIVGDVGLNYLKQWAINCVLASVYRAIESEPALSIIYDDKCQGMKHAFENDPGLVEEPFSPNERAQVKGSTRPETNWKRNESQW